MPPRLFSSLWLAANRDLQRPAEGHDRPRFKEADGRRNRPRHNWRCCGPRPTAGSRRRLPQRQAKTEAEA